jgi:hypothetical protein
VCFLNFEYSFENAFLIQACVVGCDKCTPPGIYGIIVEMQSGYFSMNFGSIVIREGPNDLKPSDSDMLRHDFRLSMRHDLFVPRSGDKCPSQIGDRQEEYEEDYVPIYVPRTERFRHRAAGSDDLIRSNGLVRQHQATEAEWLTMVRGRIIQEHDCALVRVDDLENITFYNDPSTLSVDMIFTRLSHFGIINTTVRELPDGSFTAGVYLRCELQSAHNYEFSHTTGECGCKHAGLITQQCQSPHSLLNIAARVILVKADVFLYKLAGDMVALLPNLMNRVLISEHRKGCYRIYPEPPMIDKSLGRLYQRLFLRGILFHRLYKNMPFNYK